MMQLFKKKVEKCGNDMPIEEGQVIMEESIWKWRKKMLCNVIWKGRV